MEMIMVGTMLVTFVVMSSYPIITLILLNRPKTKEWFANRPD
jgi:preprotein translocase subunit SecG